MLIREATIRDSAEISVLIQSLAKKYIACEFSSDGAQILLASMEPEAIERCFESEFKYHVAVEGDILAGVVGVRENKHLCLATITFAVSDNSPPSVSPTSFFRPTRPTSLC